MGPCHRVPLEMHCLKFELKAMTVHQPIDRRAGRARDGHDKGAIYGAAGA